MQFVGDPLQCGTIIGGEMVEKIPADTGSVHRPRRAQLRVTFCGHADHYDVFAVGIAFDQATAMRVSWCERRVLSHSR